jgi:hypothetical protein
MFCSLRRSSRGERSLLWSGTGSVCLLFAATRQFLDTRQDLTAVVDHAVHIADKADFVPNAIHMVPFRRAARAAWPYSIRRPELLPAPDKTGYRPLKQASQ